MCALTRLTVFVALLLGAASSSSARPVLGAIADCTSGEPVNYQVLNERLLLGDVIIGEATHLTRGCIHQPGALSDFNKSNARPPAFLCNALPFDWDRAGCADKWPDASVPYFIDSNVRSQFRALIAEAASHLQVYTGLYFFPATGSPDSFVFFTEADLGDDSDEDPCGTSYVGRLPPGRLAGGTIVRGQPIELSTRSFCHARMLTVLIHEMIHAVGFFHEHQRSDRDAYVNTTCTGGNWDKQQHTPYGPYDYVSVMHYGESSCMSANQSLAFVQNPRCRDGLGQAIWTKVGNACLSDHDIAGVRKFYGLDARTTSTANVALVAANYLRRVSAASVQSVRVVEFFHAGFGHFFVTDVDKEIAALDGGTIAGWTRTGESFNAFSSNTAGAANVCRFFSASFAPRSSHFYTPSSQECEAVRSNPNWSFEGEVFAFRLPDAYGNCPVGTAPLYRVYNNGQSGAPNHRYVISLTARAQMLAQGWVAEGFGASGVIGCVPN